MPLRAVVFDFDGVLADTEPLHLEAYQDVLRDHGVGLTTEEYYDRYLGFDDEGVFRTLASDLNKTWSDADILQLIERKAHRFAALLSDRDVLFHGAAALVRELAAVVPLAVASGALRPEIETVLERAGLRSCFGAIVASGETPHSKPAPDPYLKAVGLISGARLDSGFRRNDDLQDMAPNTGSAAFSPRDRRNRAASGFVAIEDSHWGIESAQAAGLRCVAVAHTYAASELASADLVLPSVGDVTLDALRDLCDKG